MGLFTNPLQEIEDKFERERQIKISKFTELCEVYQIDPQQFKSRYELAWLMIQLSKEETKIIIEGTAALHFHRSTRT